MTFALVHLYAYIISIIFRSVILEILGKGFGCYKSIKNVHSLKFQHQHVPKISFEIIAQIFFFFQIESETHPFCAIYGL